MGYIEILVLVSIIFAILAYFALIKSNKNIFIMSSLICLFLYSIFKGVFILSVIVVFFVIVFLYYYYKLKNKSFSIKLVETNPDSNDVKEFLKTCKKDIYNMFPFYEYSKEQVFFLVYNDENIIGILIIKIDGDVLNVVVDYIKPIYISLEVGNYIYNKNPGYFKNLGINKIISESFHRGYSRSLKRLGFKLENIENKQFYVKYFD